MKITNTIEKGHVHYHRQAELMDQAAAAMNEAVAIAGSHDHFAVHLSQEDITEFVRRGGTVKFRVAGFVRAGDTMEMSLESMKE